MSANRLRYDQCAYSDDLRIQSSALSYILDPIKYYRCPSQVCRLELGILAGNNVSQIQGNLVDLENHLRGQSYEASRCANMKYLPTGGDTIQGKTYWNPTIHPKINTQKKHLPSCQFIDYQPVPLPPPLDLFSCSSRK
jgi:hypothetical protein